MIKCRKVSWRCIASRPDLATALRAVRQRAAPVRVELAPAEQVRLPAPTVVLGADQTSEDFRSAVFLASFL